MRVNMENNKIHSFLFLSSINDTKESVLTVDSNTDCNLKRVDDKIHVRIDDDGVINEKYKWLDLYYEATPKIRQPESIIYISNNKYLEQSLNKIFFICNIEVKHISYMMPFLLQKLSYEDGEILKCEIFNKDMIENTYSIKYSDIDYVNRIYIRFSFVGKKGKDVINAKYNIKKGILRMNEYIFDVI